MYKKTQGFILKITPFKETNSFITLFTKQGLISLLLQQKKNRGNLYSKGLDLLVESEFVFIQKNNNLLIALENKIITSNLFLRKNYETLLISGKMAEAILVSQIPGNSSPKLYDFFSQSLFYLTKISQPELILSTFLLKLMKYEGLFSSTKECSVCKKILSNNLFREGGQIFCEKHKTNKSLLFEKNEEVILQALLQSKKFSSILSLAQFNISLSEKISNLFFFNFEK